MIINRIVVEGLFSYRTRQELDLSRYQSVLVSGQFNGDSRKSCGSGKSALFEAIPICFYGKKGSRADVMQSLINRDCASAYVEIHFEFEGNNYIKVRQWGKKDKNELLMERSGVFESIASRSEADTAIINLLGLDHISFFSTVFFKQKGSLPFIEGKSTERKAILQELFNLKVYDDAQKLTKQYADDYRIKLAASKDRKEQCIEIIEEEDDVRLSLSEYQTKVKSATNKLDGNKIKLDVLQGQISGLKKGTEDQSHLIEKVQQSEAQLQEVDRRIIYLERDRKRMHASVKKHKENVIFKTEEVKSTQETIDTTLKDLEKYEVGDTEKVDTTKLKGRTKELQEKKEIAFSKKNKHSSSIQHLESDLKKLRQHEGVCPVLKQRCSRINFEQSNEYVAATQADIEKYQTKIASIEEKCRLILEYIEKTELKLESATKHNAKIDNYNLTLEKTQTVVEALKSKLQAYSDGIQESQKVIQDYEQGASELDEQIKKEETKKESIKEAVKSLATLVDNNLLNQFSELEKEKNQINEEQDKLHIYINACSEKIGIYKNKRKMITEAKAKLATVEKQYGEDSEVFNAYEKLLKTFGRNGIQKAIMKNAVPMLESMANRLLGVFAPEKEIYIKFDLDPKTKDGKEKAQGGLEILITENDKEMNLSLYSGGETTKIALSILLSLSELLNKRAGKRMETLIIDERISGLDEADIMQFQEIVDIINARYRRFIVITHIAQLKEIFEDNIVVNYTDDYGSEVET